MSLIFFDETGGFRGEETQSEKQLKQWETHQTLLHIHPPSLTRTSCQLETHLLPGNTGDIGALHLLVIPTSSLALES